MTKVHKNIISFSLGNFFIYFFVWLVGVAAAMPVLEVLRPYNEFVVSYYSNILIVMCSVALSFVIMFMVRKALTIFTKQNLFYFALPIVIFFTYLSVFLSFAVVPLTLAIIPTLLIASAFANMK